MTRWQAWAMFDSREVAVSSLLKDVNVALKGLEVDAAAETQQDAKDNEPVPAEPQLDPDEVLFASCGVADLAGRGTHRAESKDEACSSPSLRGESHWIVTPSRRPATSSFGSGKGLFRETPSPRAPSTSKRCATGPVCGTPETSPNSPAPARYTPSVEEDWIASPIVLVSPAAGPAALSSAPSPTDVRRPSPESVVAKFQSRWVPPIAPLPCRGVSVVITEGAEGKRRSWRSHADETPSNLADWRRSLQLAPSQEAAGGAQPRSSSRRARPWR